VRGAAKPADETLFSVPEERIGRVVSVDVEVEPSTSAAETAEEISL